MAPCPQPGSLADCKITIILCCRCCSVWHGLHGVRGQLLQVRPDRIVRRSGTDPVRDGERQPRQHSQPRGGELRPQHCDVSLHLLYQWTISGWCEPWKQICIAHKKQLRKLENRPGPHSILPFITDCLKPSCLYFSLVQSDHLDRTSGSLHRSLAWVVRWKSTWVPVHVFPFPFLLEDGWTDCTQSVENSCLLLLEENGCTAGFFFVQDLDVLAPSSPVQYSLPKEILPAGLVFGWFGWFVCSDVYKLQPRRAKRRPWGLHSHVPRRKLERYSLWWTFERLRVWKRYC